MVKLKLRPHKASKEPPQSRKVGRPPKNEVAMTPYERLKAYRQRQKEAASK